MLTWRRAVCTGQQTNLFLYLASAIPVCNGQAASSSPTLHWADRNYHLFLTITTPALHSPQPWLESSGKLQISTSSCASDESCPGGFTVELRHQVDPGNSSWRARMHRLDMTIKKAARGRWQSLLSSHAERLQVKIDWSKYMDLDDELDEEERASGLRGPSVCSCC